MKLYAKILAILGLTFVTYGVAVPAMTSSYNSFACILGAVLAVLMPVPIAMLLAWTWRDDGVQRLLKGAAKLLPLMLVLAVTPSLGGCVWEYHSVKSGEELVVVNKYGDSKGVDSSGEVRGPGRYWLGYNQEGYIFPTFTRNATWTLADGQGITFQTGDGMAIGADIGAAVYVERGKSGIAFQKWKKGMDELTDIVVRQVVIDSLNTQAAKLKVNDAYGEKREELLQKALAAVQTQMKPFGIVVERLSWIGKLRLPDKIVAAIDNTVEANQKSAQRENEVKESEAKAKKVEAEAQGEANAILSKARAQAEANKLLAQSLSPELVNYTALEKWAGGCTSMCSGDTSGFVPFVNTARK